MGERIDKRYSKQVKECTIREHLAQMEYHAYWASQEGTQKAYHLEMHKQHKEELEWKLDNFIDLIKKKK